ncbi:hypothetical protein FACS189491_04740 [Spirochaetia bacterium]|nr:hypothetical protein FACS189491_04740 [Spirochaetia bacterium]
MCVMESTYKLNTRELKADFITAICDIYPDRDIEITVRETVDETEYLLRSPANREWLLKAVDNIKRGQNLVSFENLESAVKCAQE